MNSIKLILICYVRSRPPFDGPSKLPHNVQNQNRLTTQRVAVFSSAASIVESGSPAEYARFTNRYASCFMNEYSPVKGVGVSTQANKTVDPFIQSTYDHNCMVCAIVSVHHHHISREVRGFYKRSLPTSRYYLVVWGMGGELFSGVDRGWLGLIEVTKKTEMIKRLTNEQKLTMACVLKLQINLIIWC